MINDTVEAKVLPTKINDSTKWDGSMLASDHTSAMTVETRDNMANNYSFGMSTEKKKDRWQVLTHRQQVKVLDRIMNSTMYCPR